MKLPERKAANLVFDGHDAEGRKPPFSFSGHSFEEHLVMPEIKSFGVKYLILVAKMNRVFQMPERGCKKCLWHLSCIQNHAFLVFCRILQRYLGSMDRTVRLELNEQLVRRAYHAIPVWTAIFHRHNLWSCMIRFGTE